MEVPKLSIPFAYLAVLLTLAHIAWATKSKEITDNSISIRFDQVTTEMWIQEAAAEEFLRVVAESASSYCNNSMGADSICKIGTDTSPSKPFSKDDIKIMSGYPKDENADVQIVFYISIEAQPKPDNVPNQYALKKSALEAMLKENKDDISDATNHQVMFIGDERVGAPLDSTLNTIIIPIAIGMLVLLILITCCLNCREKKREKSALKNPKLPTSDAHDEGVVLTAMNKGSSGAKPTEQTNNKNEEDNPTV